MKLTDHLAGALRGNLMILEMTLADFSDADMMVRPVPAANNANWQLGHLILAEWRMGGMIGAKFSELPAGFAEQYNKEAAKNDDPAKFLSKEKLLTQFKKTREELATAVSNLTDEQLAAPGPEQLKRMCATVADVCGLFPGHTMMHVGQFQVIRRKLGKPVLF